MKLVFTLTAILCFLVVLIAVFVWSGRYNVAANVPHWDVTHWFLGKVRDRSISSHSKGIIIPSLKDPKLVDIGFDNYHAMCRLCHGAPGYSQTEITLGLYPRPPDLISKDVQEWKDVELYWIVKNGIKMTGMPAFGPTHSEDEVWGIVAFLRRLPKLNPKGYQAMVEAGSFKKEGVEDHHHGK